MSLWENAIVCIVAFLDCPAVKTILASPVIAAAIALLAVIPYAIYFYWQRKRKAHDAISLIHQYAQDAEEITAQWLKGFGYIMKNIEDGDPYGEPKKNYTPLICYAGSTNLSFEQMSEIRRYLTKDQQACLFKYYMIQSAVDATVDEIHTDFVRSFPTERKILLWNGLKEQAEELREKAGNLAEALGEHKGIAGS